MLRLSQDSIVVAASSRFALKKNESGCCLFRIIVYFRRFGIPLLLHGCQRGSARICGFCEYLCLCAYACATYPPFPPETCDLCVYCSLSAYARALHEQPGPVPPAGQAQQQTPTSPLWFHSYGFPHGPCPHGSYALHWCILRGGAGKIGPPGLL